MTRLADILGAVDAAERTAGAALTLVDHAQGIIGRGRPQWHRWRALRLRARALRLEQRGDKPKAHVLRHRAALHLMHALDAEGIAWRIRPWKKGGARPVGNPYHDEVAALLGGFEPLEGEEE